MHKHRAQTRFAWHFLVVVGTVMIMGCQTAACRRHPQRSFRPDSGTTQSYAACDAGPSVLTPSASARPQFKSEVAPPASPFATQDANPAVQSATDVAESFRRLRGKLRANDDGAIVEADLSYSDINDESLASIEIFQEIKELDLTGTQVHDESLVVLQQLPNLQSLKLKGTRISSVGMTSLTQISSLVLLDASNTAVTDDGLVQASQWTSLRYLSLNNTTVTDVAIPYLTSIKSLKGLSLLNTGVTAEGSRMLKVALPDCLVVTKLESELSPSAAVDSLRPVPTQSGVAFPDFPATSDSQLEQLIELAGRQPALAVHLASVYTIREQWPQAVRILAAAAKVNPQLPQVQLALGAARSIGGLDRCKTHLILAVGEAAANYKLGLIEYENNLRSCATHFREAVAADPSLADAQTRLYQVQQELSALKQQRAPIRAASSSSANSTDHPLEVIPAPRIRPATFSNLRPR
ncbi:MAG: hypothetical protein WKF77_20365 [Planctomycetaceae bacterium]